MSSAAPSLTRGMGWLALGYGARAVGFLGLAALLAHELGPDGYGRLALFLAIGAGIAALAGAWPFLAVPVLAPRHGVPGPLGGALGIAAIGLAAGTVLAAIALPVAVAALAGLYACGLVGLHAVSSVLQTAERHRDIALLQGADRLVALAVMGAVASGAGLVLDGARAGLAAAALLSAAAAWQVVVARPGLAPRGGGEWRAVLGAVGAMGIVAVCAYVVQWGDVLVLAAATDDRTVGFYTLAYQVVTVPVQVAALWIVVALPAHVDGRAPALARSVVTGWGGAVAVFSAGVALLLVVAFGEGYSDARAPCLALLASVPFAVVYVAGVPRLIAAGRARDLAVLSVVAALVNLGLDVALVGPLGIWAPVVGTLVQNVGVAVAMTILVGGDLRRDLLLVALGPASGIALLAVLDGATWAAATLAAAGALLVARR